MFELKATMMKEMALAAAEQSSTIHIDSWLCSLVITMTISFEATPTWRKRRIQLEKIIHLRQHYFYLYQPNKKEQQNFKFFLFEILLKLFLFHKLFFYFIYQLFSSIMLLFLSWIFLPLDRQKFLTESK